MPVIGIVVVGVLAAGLVLMRRGARRFAEKQKQLGRWDDQGPLVETRGPPTAGWPGAMNERLEVAGQWDAPVVKDRRPKTSGEEGEDSDAID